MTARGSSMDDERNRRGNLSLSAVAAGCFLAAVGVCRGDSVIMKSGVVYRSIGASGSRQHAGLHFGRVQAGRGARLENRTNRGQQRISRRREVSTRSAAGRAWRAHAQGSGERRGGPVGRSRPPARFATLARG